MNKSIPLVNQHPEAREYLNELSAAVRKRISDLFLLEEQFPLHSPFREKLFKCRAGLLEAEHELLQDLGVRK